MTAEASDGVSTTGGARRLITAAHYSTRSWSSALLGSWWVFFVIGFKSAPLLLFLPLIIGGAAELMIYQPHRFNGWPPTSSAGPITRCAAEQAFHRPVGGNLALLLHSRHQTDTIHSDSGVISQSSQQGGVFRRVLSGRSVICGQQSVGVVTWHEENLNIVFVWFYVGDDVTRSPDFGRLPSLSSYWCKGVTVAMCCHPVLIKLALPQHPR